MRRALATGVLLLALSPVATASAPPLSVRLAQALAVRGNSPAASAAMAVDLATGDVLFERNADLPLAPASNEKLLVTYAALRELGPSYRFRTEVLARGRLDEGVWRGDIFLKGFGDPRLTSSQLDRLAAQVADLGVRRIDGRVLGDESWFDSVRTARGWKSSFYRYECPPLSALVVDRAWYDHHIAYQPALAAAGRFKALLAARGIATRAAGLGRAPEGALALAQVESAPLRSVITTMDHESDNFIAEMLTKEIGAEVGVAGTTAAGAQVELRDLAAAGVPVTGVRIADGSGLSLDDRLTARTLASLLRTVWNDPDLRLPVWSGLAVAGINGTLEKRMRRAPARGVVHAKTGTTSQASALSGYVGSRFAFVVLQNGAPVRWSQAEKAEDRFATALAASFRAEPPGRSR